MTSRKKLRIHLPGEIDGYRYSLDPFILGPFLRIRVGSAVIDLGTGNGILLLLIHSRFRPGRLTGIEVQKDLCEAARRNAADSGLTGQMEIVHGDIRNVRSLFDAGSFDAAVSNPPYRRFSDGRVNPSLSKAAARHEIYCTLTDWVEAASYLLKPKGRLYLIYHPYRFAELTRTLTEKGLEPKRVRFVHPKPNTEASMVLVEALKGGKPDLKVEPPFFIRGSDGDYSEEMKRCYPDR
jgi:tRNA1Val (adenine37-N6)-methyltransferase